MVKNKLKKKKTELRMDNILKQCDLLIIILT